MGKSPFNPELRRGGRLTPRISVGPRTLKAARLIERVAARRSTGDVTVVDVQPGVSVRSFEPAAPEPGRGPALLWIHGGGYIMGSARMDDDYCRKLCDELGILVASVDYRRAPEYPFPTPLDDCYAALRWLARVPSVDPARIAIAGASAGGGLAAAVTLLATEGDEVTPAFQLLTYPMLDDRTALREDIDSRGLKLWTQKSNRYGWRSYLGEHYGGEIPPLAAPARYKDFSALPPTWIGIGTADLFHDENLAYAERLRAAGVPCELLVIDRAYHAFDMVEPDAPISRAFYRSQVDALATVLKPGEKEERVE
jgi:acetyl esterase/lipase